MRRLSVFGIGLASLLAACGTDDGGGGDDAPVDCSKVTGVDTFVAGLPKAGIQGNAEFKLLSADPAPPARGDNTWILQVNAMSGGTVGSPISGASITAAPFMPAHQHGSPKEVVITPMPDAGQYKLEPVNMWMPGVWETTIQTTGTGNDDTVVYRFCIPE